MPLETSDNIENLKLNIPQVDFNLHATNQLVNQSTDQLINYTLHLADNALIQGHRDSEWTGHGPILEQDIALSNIALDLIGQSRYFYQYAAKLSNESGGNLNTGQQTEVTEDSLAYLRDAREFKNNLIVELPNGDWAKTILKQFFFSTYQFYLFTDLRKSIDINLAAIAEKSLKEVTYHLKWSAEWVIRLGDGTEESHTRIKKALEELWLYTGELYTASEYEQQLLSLNISTDLDLLKETWINKVSSILKEATIYPEIESSHWMHSGGKNGIHTEHLGFILSEMQFLQRAYPNSEW